MFEPTTYLQTNVLIFRIEISKGHFKVVLPPMHDQYMVSDLDLKKSIVLSGNSRHDSLNNGFVRGI